MGSSDSEPDSFAYLRRFPDALDLFRFHAPSLEGVFASAVVVLDTNALLVPYKVGRSSLSEVARVLKLLKDQQRLMVPDHVLREFAINRIRRISDLYDSIHKRRSQSILEHHDYPILNEIEEYLRMAELRKDLAKKKNEHDKAARQLMSKMKEWNWDDPVQGRYEDVIDAAVVAKLEASIDDLEQEYRQRVSRSEPPGYKDESKQENAAGDFLVWKSILERAGQNPCHIVLVSADQKSDWWHRSAGESLYPRLELCDEYRRASKGHAFYLISLSHLLELCNAAPEAVNEVQRMESIASSAYLFSEPVSKLGRLAEYEVARWFERRGYLVSGNGTPDKGVDFFVSGTTSKSTPVIVKAARDVDIAVRMIRDMRSNLSMSCYPHASDPSLCVVVVFDNAEAAHVLRDRAYESLQRLGRGVRVLSGWIDASERFQLAAEIFLD